MEPRLVHHALLGTAMRAVSFDRAFVPLMGVPMDLVISATFAIGAGLADAAGALYEISRHHLRYPRECSLCSAGRIP